MSIGTFKSDVSTLVTPYMIYYYYREGDRLVWTAHGLADASNLPGELGLTAIKGSLLINISDYVRYSVAIEEWAVREESVYTFPPDIKIDEQRLVSSQTISCNHNWEIRTLFTSNYRQCSVCGKEESVG